MILSSYWYSKCYYLMNNKYKFQKSILKASKLIVREGWRGRESEIENFYAVWVYKQCKIKIFVNRVYKKLSIGIRLYSTEKLNAIFICKLTDNEIFTHSIYRYLKPVKPKNLIPGFLTYHTHTHYLSLVQ